MGGDERLWDLLGPYLEAEGVELDDLVVLGGGAGRMLRVTVDSPGGLGVDRIADLAKGISRLLDEADDLDGPYTLEVSSPGLERSLSRPAHFRKSVGREVLVKTRVAVDGERTHRGVLTEATEGELGVLVDGRDRTIPLAEVAQARTVFRWEKPAKPGKRVAR
ncbi:MAG: ribosome maturation factor RimP [Actinomycetota bacterium]